MHSGETRFMLMPHTFSESGKWCADQKCPRLITRGEACFIDLLDEGSVLCECCGKCLRYARKKAAQRGDPIESANQD